MLNRICLLLSLIVLSMSSACQKQSTEPVPGRVDANQAYLDAFGEPPVPARGVAFARVGYYPLRSVPEQVSAVPLFLFSRSNELSLLLDRLVDNPLPFPEAGPLYNPFPAGSSLRVGPVAETLELDLFLPQPAPELAAMAATLIETAGQFSAIHRVRLRLNGALWPEMPAAGFVPDPVRIVAPGPPQLLLVIGSWEPGAREPDEILVEFDRPISIDRFVIEDQSGNALEGEYFTSVFNMAVVLHPRQPSRFHEGMALRVSWQVTDQLGRQGTGTNSMPLRRTDHGETH